MKRDMDLIRLLLLKIEASEEWPVPAGDLKVPDYSQAVTDYHLELLILAGLVRASKLQRINKGRLVVAVYGLEWEGHDFLDAVRQESIWAKTKAAIGKSGFQSLPFALIRETAIAYVRQQLGLP